MKFVDNNSKLKAIRKGTAYRGLRVFIDVILGLEFLGVFFYILEKPATVSWEIRLSVGIAAILGGVLFRCLAVVGIDAADAVLDQMKD